MLLLIVEYYGILIILAIAAAALFFIYLTMAKIKQKNERFQQVSKADLRQQKQEADTTNLLQTKLENQAAAEPNLVDKLREQLITINQIQAFYNIQISQNSSEKDVEKIIKNNLQAIIKQMLLKNLQIQQEIKKNDSNTNTIESIKQKLRKEFILFFQQVKQLKWSEIVNFIVYRTTNKFNNVLNVQKLVQKQNQIYKLGYLKYYKKTTNSQLIIQSPKLTLEMLTKYFQAFKKSNYLYDVNIYQQLQANAPSIFQISFKLRILKYKDKIQQVIRKLQDQQKVISKPIENLQIFREVIGKYLTNIRRLSKQFQRNNIELEDIQSAIQKSKMFSKQIDISIVMDTTASMGIYLAKAKQDSIKIINRFKQNYKDSSVKFSFVSYKDHDLDPLCQFFDFNDALVIQEQISNVKAANSGSDWAQAMHDGLFAVLKLRWRPQSTKFVFVIYDAPPHGRQYTQTNRDKYPQGCPCGIKLQTIVKYFVENNIYINLKECGDQTGRTKEVFKQAFPKELFGVQQMQTQEFQKQISQDMDKRIKELQEQNMLFAQQLSNITSAPLQIIKLKAKKLIQQKLQLLLLNQLESQALYTKSS